MKSNQNFLPEYRALNAVPEIFWRDEHEYETLVYGQNLPPFQWAMLYGHQICESLDVFGPLKTVLDRWHERAPGALKRELDSFARQFVHQVADPFGLSQSVWEVFDPLLNIPPERHLEQVFVEWWPDDNRHESKDAARRMLDWLNEREIGQPVLHADLPDGVASTNGAIFDPLEEGSAKEYELPHTGYVINRRLQDFYKYGQQSAGALVESIQEACGVNIEEALASGQFSRRMPGLPALDADLGTDAFGTYLPFHAFAFSKNTPWGIYIFLEPLLAWTSDVWVNTGKKHPQTELFTLLFLAIYRHEMFHYHVERHAFMLEVAGRRPHYRPYVERVRKTVAKTEKWLEEALAQAVVFPSTFLRNRSFMSRMEVINLLKNEFATFGPGYRDYDCKWTGGIPNAHQRLGTQIARGVDVNLPLEWVTDLAIPKTQYNSDFKAVPGYFAFTPRIRSQFQFQTPRTKDIRRFWERQGGTIDAATGSSHQNWDRNGQKVQFVDRSGYADLNSFKKMAKLLNVSLYQLKQEVLNS